LQLRNSSSNQFLVLLIYGSRNFDKKLTQLEPLLAAAAAAARAIALADSVGACILQMGRLNISQMRFRLCDETVGFALCHS
jgi:hypothetical protein